MDKYYNKTLPFTDVSIKITYPSGFKLDIPNNISTDENGRFYHEWIIPENAVSGKYIISVMTDKEKYTGSTTSIFFYIEYKEKNPLRLELENMDISFPLDGTQFNIDFKLINPNREMTVIQFNYSVYLGTVSFGNIELFSSEYDKKSLGPLHEFNNEGEIIRFSPLFETNEISNTMRVWWDSLRLSSLQGKSSDFIVNGTFSYNPYSDLMDIENKDKFNFHYAVNKFE
jgi:hypothetical protein